jgi:hypothetical protein
MKVLDAGHEYLLHSLDGGAEQRLVFVKREGQNYPGNVGSHPGTTMQEVLRALIERAIYVDNQIPDIETRAGIKNMKEAVYHFEKRAAIRHGRPVDFDVEDAVYGSICDVCAHIRCAGHAALSVSGIRSHEPQEKSE